MLFYVIFCAIFYGQLCLASPKPLVEFNACQDI